MLARILFVSVHFRGDGQPWTYVVTPTSFATGARVFSAARNVSGYRATINGAPGAIGVMDGKIASVAAFTVVDGRITAIDILTDRARLAKIDPAILSDWPEYR